MRTLLALLVLSACSSDDGSSRDVADPDAMMPVTGTLQVLTYNVAGLPEGLSGSQPERNIPQISPLLNAFDLVLAQEDFWYHTELTAALDLPHRSMPWRTPPAVDDIGDGLALFSRYSFTDYTRTSWGACHGQLDCASDCLATKGFATARVTLAPGIEVDVVNLHMEAGDCEDDFRLRTEGVTLLVQTLREREGNRALIVAGDFNLHEEDPIDRAEVDRLLAEAGLSDACRELACTRPKIDRVLFKSGSGVTFEAQSWSIPEHFVDAESGENLSDHQPVAVTLRFARD